MSNRLILTLVLALVIGTLIWHYYPLPAGTAPGGPIADVTVPELDANLQAGKMKFETYCLSCHGVNAGGQEGVAPPLVHKIYEPSHHADQSFYLAVKLGVRAHHWPFGDMPPVEDIDDQEIAQIVNYVRALQRANGIN